MLNFILNTCLANQQISVPIFFLVFIGSVAFGAFLGYLIDKYIK